MALNHDWALIHNWAFSARTNIARTRVAALTRHSAALTRHSAALTRHGVLFRSLLLLLMISILCWGPSALAKNVYRISDSSEGDPGDGVLRPDPDITIPDVKPTPIFNPQVLSLAGPGFFQYPQPQLILPLIFYGNMYTFQEVRDPACRNAGHRTIGRFSVIIPEGRWRNAP